jgi:antitoxin Xre/MbcA/ParS-like protein
VLLRALEVFGDSDRALKWMRENNPALAGDTPIWVIQTEQGRREVLGILGRIEYGVISRCVSTAFVALSTQISMEKALDHTEDVGIALGYRLCIRRVLLRLPS